MQKQKKNLMSFRDNEAPDPDGHVDARGDTRSGRMCSNLLTLHRVVLVAVRIATRSPVFWRL